MSCKTHTDPLLPSVGGFPRGFRPAGTPYPGNWQHKEADLGTASAVVTRSMVLPSNIFNLTVANPIRFPCLTHNSLIRDTKQKPRTMSCNDPSIQNTYKHRKKDNWPILPRKPSQPRNSTSTSANLLEQKYRRT